MVHALLRQGWRFSMSAQATVLPFSPKGSSLRLQSDIPGDHPEREAIEAVCRTAFGSLSGTWGVEIRLGSRTSSWALRVTPFAGFTRTVVVGIADQNPRGMTRRIGLVLAEMRCLPLGA
jgi:hypothetical protein